MASTDVLEQQLLAAEESIGRLRGYQLGVLKELDRRQVATGDDCRSMSEWVAARLDTSVETARSLVQTMRRIQNRAELGEALESGEISFDRVEALSKVS